MGGSGNGDMYEPDFLIEKQTILVTFNYRLGVLGFLSLNSPEYSGNMGLKDVQLALKWTNENIERFGGDSKRITVFGHSAGNINTIISRKCVEIYLKRINEAQSEQVHQKFMRLSCTSVLNK